MCAATASGMYLRRSLPSAQRSRQGGAIAVWNKTGLCRKHALEQHNANAESQARRVVALKRRFAIDPELRHQHRERARKLHTLPQSREAKVRRYTPEFQRKGVEALRNMPEVRRLANAKMSATKLAWCPPALRDEYRHLTQRKAFPAPEARQMIEEQHELEMARWRRSVGITVEPSKIEFVESDYTPVEKAIELVAARFGITIGKLFSEDRHKTFVNARCAVAVAMRRNGCSLPVIATALHKNDHTSSRHWCLKGEDLCTRDRKFSGIVDELVACWHQVEMAA
jgi:Bacterial dnaA protein helix-turn-helix